MARSFSHLPDAAPGHGFLAVFVSQDYGLLTGRDRERQLLGFHGFVHSSECHIL